MNENEIELRERLRELGQRPIDADAQELHLRRMEAVGVSGEPRRRSFVWAGVAAAALVGFMAGSTGLAMAGALPGRAQDVAHDVLGAVQVDVPSGKEGKRGPCVSEAAKIKDEDAKKAAIAACPKGGPDDTGDGGNGGNGPEGSPGKSGDAPGKSAAAPGQVKHEGDPCHGRPPWAGKMSKEEREAAKQAASRDACPPDADDDGESEADEESDDADEAGDEPVPINQDLTTATTTIAEQPTTTVAEATTTTTTTTTPETSG
jgi:hypothetical protein